MAENQGQASTPRPREGSTKPRDPDSLPAGHRHTAAEWNGATGAVLAYSAADPIARFVLVAVAHHAGNGRAARPTMGRLAELTGFDYGTIRRAIDRLERLGELVTQRTGRAHRFVIVLPGEAVGNPVDTPDVIARPARSDGNVIARDARTDRAPRAIRSRALRDELLREQLKDDAAASPEPEHSLGSAADNTGRDPVRPSPADAELGRARLAEARAAAARTAP